LFYTFLIENYPLFFSLTIDDIPLSSILTADRALFCGTPGVAVAPSCAHGNLMPRAQSLPARLHTDKALYVHSGALDDESVTSYLP